MEAVEKPEEPIPGNSSRLAGNPNWGTATVVGVFAGMLYGGSKEASASVSKDAEVMLKMGSTQDKREQHRLLRDAMEKRFIRVTRGSLIGGMRLGMFTASFFSLQNFLAETRGVHDVFNVVGAGSATAAVFGLISTDTSHTLHLSLDLWLIAFEGGSIIRSIFLLLSCSFLWALQQETKLKILTFITFFGLKVKYMENVTRSVLPKFFLESLNLQVYDIWEKTEYSKVVFTSLPQVIVERFLVEYI